MKINLLNGKLNIVGKNIKEYRELKDMTLRELSEKLELYGVVIYHTDIHRIENGKRSIRDFELKAFSKVLNVKIEDLYKNTDKDFE